MEKVIDIDWILWGLVNEISGPANNADETIRRSSFIEIARDKFGQTNSPSIEEIAHVIFEMDYIIANEMETDLIKLGLQKDGHRTKEECRQEWWPRIIRYAMAVHEMLKSRKK